MKSLSIIKAFTIANLALCSFAFTSCEKKENPAPQNGNELPITLDCNYFKDNPNAILKDNPNAPVDYVITCVMQVRSDIKIEPGVVIEFEQNAGIEIDDFNIPKASLSAVGTSSKPIIFRGVKKEKGYWKGIMFNSSSPDNKLIYAHVEDAGGSRFNSNGDLGAIHIYASGQLTMENSTVSNSKSYGLNAVYTKATLMLKNNTFTDNNAPVIVNPGYLDALNNTNKYKGNFSDYVEVNPYGEEITKPTTWHKIDVPYKVISNAVKHIRVRNLLTIQPGVVIEFGAETYLNIYEDGGGLKAVGTPSDPIIFTGTSKVAKAWRGIYIESKHAETEIAFAEIKYSGIDAPKGNIWLWYNALLNIHHVKFTDINGCGVNYRLLSGQDSNPNLTIGENISINNEGCKSGTW